LNSAQNVNKKLFFFVNDTMLECLPLTYGREHLSALQQTLDYIGYKYNWPSLLFARVNNKKSFKIFNPAQNAKKIPLSTTLS
jgi:hypothetical protein